MAKNRFFVFKVIRKGHDLDLENSSSVVFLFRRHTYTDKMKAVSLEIYLIQNKIRKRPSDFQGPAIFLTLTLTFRGMQ